MHAEFSYLEFQAVDGQYRLFYGCSLVGVLEFEERIKQIHSHLTDVSTEATIQELYCSSSRFRFLCDRCLELNGIKPEWVNFDMLTQLLFGTEQHAPYLITLNQPYKPKRPQPSAKASSKAELLAAIATHCGSIDEAYKLATTVPARELMAVLDAKNELTKPLEERKKADKDEQFKSWAARRRAEMAKREGAA